MRKKGEDWFENARPFPKPPTVAKISKNGWITESISGAGLLVWKLMQRSPNIRRGLRRAAFTGGWLEDVKEPAL